MGCSETMLDEMKTTSQRSLRLLLVEDDDDHAEILMRTMARSGVAHSLERVSDGEAAMRYVRQQGEFADRPRPHLVVLDWKLPRRNGHEVLKDLKSDADLCTIPVVVLTTSAAESDRVRAYSLHANSFIVKPANFARFRQMVDDLSNYWATWSAPPDPLPLSG